MQNKLLFCFLTTVCINCAFAQQESTIYFKGAIRANRDILHRNIQKSIDKNLSLPLTGDTEENWADAFSEMELIRYRPLWTDSRIDLAFDSVATRSSYFQRALLELAYASYPGRYTKQVAVLFNRTDNAKIFALCAEYLLKTGYTFSGINFANRKQQLVKNKQDEAIIGQLLNRIPGKPTGKNSISVAVITGPDFLPGHTVLYSFQRRNRDYPGLAMIRDSAGNFVKDGYGNIFSVPQIARSVSNMPGYLTNGNTPQGIFRMYGFDTSKTYFIGPTTNIQLTMPFETSLQHFFNDSTIMDTAWTEEWYRKLLPPALKNNAAFFESFYAGKAGRSEIIAHGTTVDPAYYTGTTYYPQTPTIGCLCTKEIWSETDGKRLESDQQKLANTLLLAGGPDGYCVVIEIDDAQKPVTPDDILPLLKPQ